MKYYQVDTFTKELFKGNAAGVCPLDEWIEEDLMQEIAAENNLSETAFFVKSGTVYNIRWFTPEEEIDLCGHATLASAFIIFNYINRDETSLHFKSHLSGDLFVERNKDLISLNFPSRPGQRVEDFNSIREITGLNPVDVYKDRDYMVVLDREEEVVNYKPDFKRLKELDSQVLIITAKGNKTDFVSRCFIPESVITEDPVTGSAHCTLIPYWSKKLNKKSLTAYQASKRGGYLYLEDLGERVTISGYAKLYMEGSIKK